MPRLAPEPPPARKYGSKSKNIQHAADEVETFDEWYMS